MKSLLSNLLLLTSVMLITFTCTEDPAGPDVNDELKPHGSITGWVYDKNGSAISDVLVSVNADSASAGISDAAGKFVVGNVLEGTYTLRFTHRDYDNDTTYSITLSQGVDETVLPQLKS